MSSAKTCGHRGISGGISLHRMEPISLELHYPANWAYEGEVEVLWSEGNGAERSYGRLSQGATMVRETFEVGLLFPNTPYTRSSPAC